MKATVKTINALTFDGKDGNPAGIVLEAGHAYLKKG